MKKKIIFLKTFCRTEYRGKLDSWQITELFKNDYFMINCPFIKDTLYLVKPNFDCLSSYKGAYSNEQSLNFVIPIIVILFLGVIYIMTQRADSGFVSFFLIGAAALTMFYWVRVLKKMAKDQKPLYTQSREQEQKNWVYDLIKGEGEFVFVAEVPGPEDKVAVRLVDGMLYIRGTGGFSKEVPIEGANDMQIFDFKYRNGVLTLRIK